MTGLNAKTLWSAYTQTGYVSRHPNDDPHRALRAKLHDALTAKLDEQQARIEELEALLQRARQVSPWQYGMIYGDSKTEMTP